MILAHSAAKKFGASPSLALVLAGALIYPSIVTLVSEGANITFLGIPVVLMRYSSTVFPIILAVYVLSFLEKFLNSKFHASF